MARTKITEGSPILTQCQAIGMLGDIEFKTSYDTKYFKQDIRKLLDNIVIEKHYYNEVGIEALGRLLKNGVEIEVSISSDSDKRRKYRCVKFNNGSFGCTCVNFVTYQNVLKPRGKCKHIKTLIDKGTF